jgi:hypothetical protein
MVLLAGAAAAQSGGNLPRRPVPNGFEMQDCGTGRLLTSGFQGNAQSATMVARG